MELLLDYYSSIILHIIGDIMVDAMESDVENTFFEFEMCVSTTLDAMKLKAVLD